jgi:LPS-assembly protein
MKFSTLNRLNFKSLLRLLAILMVVGYMHVHSAFAAATTAPAVTVAAKAAAAKTATANTVVADKIDPKLVDAAAGRLSVPSAQEMAKDVASNSKVVWFDKVSGKDAAKFLRWVSDTAKTNSKSGSGNCISAQQNQLAVKAKVQKEKSGVVARQSKDARAPSSSTNLCAYDGARIGAGSEVAMATAGSANIAEEIDQEFESRSVFVKTENTCGGYYLEPEIVAKTINPAPIGASATTITATEPVLLAHDGVSKLSGNVTITQPGRQITTEHALFFRNAATKEISSGTMVGNVNVHESGKIIVAQDGSWDANSNLITLNHSLYRMYSPSPGRAANIWGRALRATRDEDGVLKLRDATYTTCNPDNNSWKVWGKNITLNKKTGRGSVTHAVLMVHDAPVFYLPYISFAIDKERKSGFLYPEFSNSPTSGFGLSLPYYLNLAPNYDATITPRIYTKRGFFAQGLFRYLTPIHTGTVDVRYIGYDREFSLFRQQMLQTYAITPTNDNSLARLRSSGNSRGFFAYRNRSVLNKHWSSNVNFNYVSDDYFFQDFGNAPTNDKDQLLNQFDVAYAGENWSFSALTQAFQTLRPINSQSVTAQEQYRRLPQFDVKGDFPNQKYGLDYQVLGKFVYFDYDHRFDPVTKVLRATGSRTNVIPSVSLPLHWAGGYITPRVQLHSTFYGLKDNLVVPGMGGGVIGGTMKDSVSRVLPIVSLDSGMFMSRITKLLRKDYTQTLEPRVFYLFVPDRAQNDIPVFDSSLSSFSFDQLFAVNRFSGYDRVGDASQISVALTTRFLDAYTAEEKVRISVGQMYALRKHRVCMNAVNGDCTLSAMGSGDPLMLNNLSPTVGQLQYNLTPNWSATAEAAWDGNTRKFNNGSLNVRYHKGVNRIVNLGYNFVQNGDPVVNISNLSKNLSRVNFSFAWPIKENWNIVGDWNYNLSHDHSQEYFYGLEYQNCCWALRIVQHRTFAGTDERNNNTFRSATYLQFILKGLGGVGSGDAGAPLTRMIPGYTNNFAGGGRQIGR